MTVVATIRSARLRLRDELTPLYGTRESAFIADWTLEKITGLTREACRTNPEQPLLPAHSETLGRYLSELLRWRPVQYVLGEAWFHGRTYQVDERVLIPRPETEELVDWVAARYSPPTAVGEGVTRILDIGTGSGCIAISLWKLCPWAKIWGLDVSPDALAVARQNADRLDAAIDWLQLDLLDPQSTETIPEVDVIVSNPPYVLNEDRNDMRRNVLDWEPHSALFVEGTDPLLFYHRIAELGLQKLASGGEVYVEIQETQSEAVLQLFHARGYLALEARKDLAGRDRMVRARKA